MKKGVLVWLLVPFVVVLDQATKVAAVRELTEFQPLTLIPRFFNLTLTYNKGIAFGMLANMPDSTRQLWISAATATALLTILYFLLSHFRKDVVAHAALALIVGGAVGNIIDRLMLGRVVDFLDVYYGKYHWPAFNVADSAVCIGVVILLFRPSKKHPAKEPSTETI